jgi:hypothetical protein
MFLTLISPRITVTEHWAAFAASTTKSTGSSVGLTMIKAVGVVIVYDDGGDVLDSFLMNLTIPLAACA